MWYACDKYEMRNMIYLLVKFHENWVMDRHVNSVGEGVSWETPSDKDIYIYMYIYIYIYVYIYIYIYIYMYMYIYIYMPA